MNDYLGLIQLNLVITRTNNLAQWETIQAEREMILNKIKSLIFTEGVAKQVLYLESHQLTINLLGSFIPEDESDLVLKYRSDQEFKTGELPRLLSEAMPDLDYRVELGSMNFTVFNK